VNPLFDDLACNLGDHTAHHMRPGVHGSRRPEIHAAIEAKIPEGPIQTGFW
jgi:fatty acid desaturase